MTQDQDHERITELEVRYAYQQQVIEELNGVVIDLVGRLERAERQVQELSEAILTNPTDDSPELPE